MDPPLSGYSLEARKVIRLATLTTGYKFSEGNFNQISRFNPLHLLAAIINFAAKAKSPLDSI